MAFAAAPLDGADAVDAVERKLRLLEKFAVAHRGGLPDLGAPRVFRTDKALFNAVESTLVRIERIAATVPKVVSTGRSHIQAAVVDYDPGEAFTKGVAAAVAQLVAAAAEIGKLGGEFGEAAIVVKEQSDLFRLSVEAEAALISRASKMAKPADPVVFKEECQALVDASADAAELKYDVDVRSPLHNHVMSLADAAAALGWVVSGAALKHARDYKAIVNTQAEDILSRYIDLGCNPVHSEFAESLNAVMDAVCKYVEKEHPAGLRWNYAAGATPLGYRRANRTMAKDAHPIGDFYRLMHSALTEFVLTSRELGGTLAKIAEPMLNIYVEMAKVIEVASNKIHPPGDGGGELRMLLMPVQHELTPLIAILEKVDKADKYREHAIVVQEFIAVMQWCTSTLQKMSPVGYIIDIEAVTVLYIDRLERDLPKGNGYISTLHRRWACSVRQMMVELKEYVKVHHPNELMFDTQRSRKSVDALVRSVNLTNQLKKLKLESKSKRWVRGSRTRTVRGGGKRSFPAWVRSG